MTMIKKVNISTAEVNEIERVNATVSENLKKFRLQSGMTLDELSRKAGVSKGMLVEIEKGSANPSIATLCKAALALNVAVADFVGVSSTSSVQIIPEHDSPILWRGDRGGSAKLLVGTNGPDEIELWEWKIYPGEEFSSDGHSHGTTELLHVHSGVLTLIVQDEVYSINTGVSAIAKTDQAHSYINNGSDLVMFTMVVAEFSRQSRLK
ncbi:helix-turn-helix domain-containing protein [Brucellaceae bacterium C25G]